MASTRVVDQTFDGIEQVDIINRTEAVRIRTGRGRKGRVRIRGKCRHPLFAVSAGDGVLYLIAFDGEITVPSSVMVSYTRGARDLRRALVDAYAPSLSYAQFVETKRVARDLARFSDVPTDAIMELTRRLTAPTTRPFTASQVELSSPPALMLLEREARAAAFAWNGPYAAMPKFQQGQLALIPEIVNGPVDQVFARIMDFSRTKLALGRRSVKGLVHESNKVGQKKPPQLLDFVLKIQETIPKAEVEVRALATTATTAIENRMLDALAELRAKKLPYAATLMQQVANAGFPISQDSWIPVMAKIAAMEATQRRRGPSPSPSSAPASEKTTEAYIDYRDAEQVESALKGKQQFSMCLQSHALTLLREYQLSDKYQEITVERVKEWQAREKHGKTSPFTSWTSVETSATRGSSSRTTRNTTNTRSKRPAYVRTISSSKARPPRCHRRKTARRPSPLPSHPPPRRRRTRTMAGRITVPITGASRWVRSPESVAT